MNHPPEEWDCPKEPGQYHCKGFVLEQTFDDPFDIHAAAHNFSDACGSQIPESCSKRQKYDQVNHCDPVDQHKKIVQIIVVVAPSQIIEKEDFLANTKWVWVK
jgi:hypothetical protein